MQQQQQQQQPQPKSTKADCNPACLKTDRDKPTIRYDTELNRLTHLFLYETVLAGAV